MATTEKQREGGVIVQSWVPPTLARELKAQADRSDRSVSSLIRIAVQNQLDAERRTRR